MSSTSIWSQDALFARFQPLLGSWQGNGSGYGGSSSTIDASFRPSESFIKVIHHAVFKGEDGESAPYHHDEGFISFDKNREQFVYRQFNSEGYINQYVLDKEESDDSTWVFIAESFENFDSEAKAVFRLVLGDNSELQTRFDLSLPGQKTMCIGKNTMHRKEEPAQTTRPRVSGIGGIFFFSKQPQQLKAWYAENLGLAVNDYGSSFEFRNAHRPDEINYLQWSPFHQSSDYFQPSEKHFMINYRVEHLDELLASLKAKGISILGEVQTYPYGKFAHLMDPEGNKIELWEAIDSVFTEMGGPTSK